MAKITPEVTPSRPLIIRALSAAVDHMIVGFAIAGAAMHPGVCPPKLFEPDPLDSASEPPSALEA